MQTTGGEKKKKYKVAIRWGTSPALTKLSSKTSCSCVVTCINRPVTAVFETFRDEVFVEGHTKVDHLFVATDAQLSEAQIRTLTQTLRHVRIKTLEVVVLCDTANAFHPFLFHCQSYHIRKADKTVLHKGKVDINNTSAHLFDNVMHVLALPDLFMAIRSQTTWYSHSSEYVRHLFTLLIEQLSLVKYRQIESKVEWDLLRFDTNIRQTTLSSTLQEKADTILRCYARSLWIAPTTYFPLDRKLVSTPPDPKKLCPLSGRFAPDRKIWKERAAFADFAKYTQTSYPEDTPTIRLRQPQKSLVDIYGTGILNKHPFEVVTNPFIQATLTKGLECSEQKGTHNIILHPTADLNNELVIAVLVGGKRPYAVPLTPLWLLAFFLIVRTAVSELWIKNRTNILLYLRRYIKESYVPISMSYPVREPFLRVPCDIALMNALETPIRFSHLSGITGHIYDILRICAVLNLPAKPTVCLEFARVQLQQWFRRMLRYKHSGCRVELMMRVYAFLSSRPYLLVEHNGPKILLFNEEVNPQIRQQLQALAPTEATLIPPFLDVQATQLGMGRLTKGQEEEWRQVVHTVNQTHLKTEIPSLIDQKTAQQVIRNASGNTDLTTIALLLKIRNRHIQTNATAIAIFPNSVVSLAVGSTICAGCESSPISQDFPAALSSGQPLLSPSVSSRTTKSISQSPPARCRVQEVTIEPATLGSQVYR